jgi:hypothetical protein
MPWAQVNQFVNLATQVDRHADTNASSVYPLIQVLRGPGPPVQAVQTALDGLAADKQRKYQAALGFLRTNFRDQLGRGLRAVGLGAVTAQQIQGAIGRQTHVTVAQQAAPGVAAAPMGAVAVAGTVQPVGWSLIIDPHPFTPVTGVGQAAAFTNAEIQRINEAVRRTKKAVDDAIQEISRLSPAPPPSSAAPRYHRGGLFFFSIASRRQRGVPFA